MMRSITLRAVLAAAVCAGFLPGLPVSADSPDTLSALALAAKGQFQPVSQEKIDAALEQLRAAAAALEQRLQTAGAFGAGWRSYLKWDAFLAELNKPQPQMSTMQQAYTHLASGNEGLNLIWFANVRQTLQSYLAAVQAKEAPETRQRYEKTLEGVTKLLEQASRGLSPEDASRLAGAIRWLDDTGQAPKLVAAVRENLSRTNAFGDASAALVGAGIERPIDEMTPVDDVILGTNIHGTGRTVGQVYAELVPSETCAVIDTHFQATVDSRSTGYNGPAIIQSSSYTYLHGLKRIYLNEQGIHAFPAVSSADTDSNILGIGSTSGRRIVEKVASRRSAEQKPQAEAIAASRAVARVNRRMDRESDDNLARANERYQTRFRDPLTERNLFPAQLVFSSSPQSLMFQALEADPYHLGAPSAPPPTPKNVDLAVRVHQSTLNNLADKALGGMKVRDETFQATLKELLGRVPEQFKPDNENEPWAITFAADVPLTFEFFDNQFRITVRGRRYERGTEEHPAMDVVALYKIVQDGATLKAVRQGGLDIFPPGFDRSKGRLSTRQIVIRNMLERRFGKVLEPELVGEGIELPGNWKQAGPLLPVVMTSANGWMTIGWNRPVEKSSPKPASAD